MRRDATPLSAGQPNRYVPPSRRSQQGTPSEAAIDPAILSAQLASPKNNAQGKSSQATESSTPVKPAQASEKSAVPSKSVPAATATGKPAAPPNLLTQAGTAATKAPAEVAAAFSHFAKLEKMKVQNNKHLKNQQDKAVKVNDLKKFAKNFQLNTPVPKDLLPILAKDEAKQNEIVKKAQEQAEKKKKTQSEQKAPSEPAAPMPKRQSESSASGSNQASKGTSQTTPNATAPSHPLSQRLEQNRRQHKMGTAAAPPPMPVMHDGRGARQSSYSSGMPPMASPTKPGPVRGPPPGASTKLNPQVMEFRPNPMAAQFKPGSSVSGTTNVSSPSSHPVTRTITPVTVSGTGPTPSINLFREAKARDAKGIPRRPITWSIESAQTIKPRDDDTKSESKDTTPASIQQPFRQRVDWIPPTLEDDKVETLPKYKELFARDRMSRQPSFAGSVHGQQRGPHPGQYPGANGAPNMHAVPMAGQIPPHMQGQHHHYPQGGHFDDHQMRPSPSYGGYPGPSPRMHNAQPSPMPHGAQMGYPQGPYMNTGHGMPPRQYSSGPGAPGPHMQPQMMVPQGPGPYMQQQMVPMQHHPQYPVHQGMYGGPPQPNGYPSPGRGAPAMMLSGSHQGHHQPYTPNGQYAQPYHPPPGQGMQRGNYNAQPNFPQSPYQQHPVYPARTPSHGYAQPHQQPPVMTPQAPPAQPAVASSDETK